GGEPGKWRGGGANQVAVEIDAEIEDHGGAAAAELHHVEGAVHEAAGVPGAGGAEEGGAALCAQAQSDPFAELHLDRRTAGRLDEPHAAHAAHAAGAGAATNRRADAAPREPEEDLTAAADGLEAGRAIERIDGGAPTGLRDGVEQHGG